eukprot:CAMPEP_0203664798 /NCGR_PEP_ID=MMETSP0090-20130426/2143_1 /ASSEMBLY_ACC=CAM_ASM_001088 /TAXON_ID=426623 /ORGANISM="Chaetoceros affinis, Strain CCMP159" /LENGTH=471 /DNA_ID=CAMNT_0050528159 /DNA_START=45 /DNA_END=1460 /DNA_ORIENTATION=+
MSDRIPVTVILGMSLNDREATTEKAEAGYCARQVVRDTDDDSVSTFLKKYTTTRGDAWLYDVFKQRKSEDPSSSKCESAVVAFGNGEAVNLKVGKGAKSQEGFGLLIGLYQIETDGTPVFLHPDQCLFKSLFQSSSASAGAATRLLICPSPKEEWDTTFDKSDSVRDTITFILKDNKFKKSKVTENDIYPVSLPESTDCKTKKKKDSNKPKKAKTAYTFFQSDTYKKLKEQFPNKPFSEISKEIGTQWQKFSAEDRQAYEVLAKQDKTRFDNEMALYTPPSDGEDGDSDDEIAKKKQKKEKDPDKPKSYKTVYHCFCEDMRGTMKANNPDLAFKDYGKELGKRFKALTSKQRKKYEQRSAKDKIRYEREMEAYNGGGKASAEEAKDGEDEQKEIAMEDDEETSTDDSEEEEVKVRAEPRVETESSPVGQGKSLRARGSRKKLQDETPQEKDTQPKRQSTVKKRKRESRVQG